MEDIKVHATTDLNIRGPEAGQQGSAFMITGSLRELLHRMKKATDISKNFYVSIGNYTAPMDLDTTKMVYDHINFSIMDNNRRMRINSNENERVHNGSWTIRPNNNADFYSTTTQGDLYNEERWKYWDFFNIPPYNKKFFPNLAPYQTALIPDQTISAGDTLIIENWKQYFSDIEGDELSIVSVNGVFLTYDYQENEGDIYILPLPAENPIRIWITDGVSNVVSNWFEWNIL